MMVMEAEYEKQTGYPFLDALPQPIMLPELIRQLKYAPGAPAGVENMTQQERFALTERISEVYIPLDYAAAIYNSLYAGIRSAYKGRNRLSFIGEMNTIGKAIQAKDWHNFPDSNTQAECFSVLGEPGMGKTATFQKLLHTIPQVIHHTEYEGHPFDEYQVCWLKIECPANNSPRGACMQILAAIDELLGTRYCDAEKGRGSNVDMLITRIAQFCIRFHIGCIVIDEVQNILRQNNVAPSASNPMVKFMVELANKTGVCLVFVGLPSVAPYFDAEAHLARRTRGPRIPYLQDGEAFTAITDAMWACAPLRKKPITAEMRTLIFKITNGSIAKTQKLIQLSAQQAVYFGYENITCDLLRKVAKQYNIIPSKSIMESEAPAPLRAAETVTGAPMSNVPAAGSKKKGRPARTKDPDSLIEAYKECRDKGWSVTQRFIDMGVAERM